MVISLYPSIGKSFDVREVSLSVTHNTAHTRSGDNGCAELLSRTLGLDSSLQQRQEGDGSKVDRCDIGRVCVVPLLDRLTLPQLVLELSSILLVRLCLRSRNTSIGDYNTPLDSAILYHETKPTKQVDALLLLLDLLDQFLKIGLLGDIDISNTGRVISNVFVINLAGIGHTG